MNVLLRQLWQFRADKAHIVVNTLTTLDNSVPSDAQNADLKRVAQAKPDLLRLPQLVEWVNKCTSLGWVQGSPAIVVEPKARVPLGEIVAPLNNVVPVVQQQQQQRPAEPNPEPEPEIPNVQVPDCVKTTTGRKRKRDTEEPAVAAVKVPAPFGPRSQKRMRIEPPDHVDWPKLEGGAKWEHETSNTPVAFVTDLVTLSRLQQDKIDQLTETVEEYKDMPKPAELKSLREDLASQRKQFEALKQKYDSQTTQLQVERAELSTMRKEVAAMRVKMSVIGANANALPDPPVPMSF